MRCCHARGACCARAVSSRPGVPALIAICRRLKPFGCRLAVVRRSAWGGPADAVAEALLDEMGAWADLPGLAAAADVLVLACVQVRDAAASGD
jgi:hypothetical protein